MPGTKCSICHFVYEDREQFQDAWEIKDHEDIKDCIIYLGKENQELKECINEIQNRFHHEKVMRRKILD